MKIYKVIVIVLIGLGTALSTGCDKDTVSMADPEIDSTVAQKSFNSDELTPEMVDILKEHGIDSDSLKYKGLSDKDFYLSGEEAWKKILNDREVELKPLERKSDTLSYRYPNEEEHLFRSLPTPAQADFTVIDLSNPPSSGSISVHYEGIQVTTQYLAGDYPIGVAMAIRNNINNNPNIQLTAGGPIGPTVVLTEKRAGCEYNGKVVYITSSQGSHIDVNQLSMNMGGGTDDGTGCPPYVPVAPKLKLPNNGANNQPVDDLWLEWFPSDAATSYHFQIATNTSFNNPGIDVSDYNTNGAWIYGLNYGTTYYWRVRAYNSNGFSVWSGTRSFTTIPPLALGSSSFIDRYNMPGYVLMSSYTVSNYPMDIIGVNGVSMRDGIVINQKSNVNNNSTNATVATYIRKFQYEPPSNWSQYGTHTWIFGDTDISGVSYDYLNNF